MEVLSIIEESCKRHSLIFVPDFEYKNIQTEVETECLVCKYKFKRSVFSFKYNDYGCADCNGQIPYSIENLVERFYRKRPPHKTNIILLSIPKEFSLGNKTLLELACLECGFTWDWYNINNYFDKKYGCPCCTGKIQYNQENLPFIMEYVSKLPSNIKIIGRLDEVSHNESKVDVKFEECGHTEEKSIRRCVAGNVACTECMINKKFTRENVYERVYAAKPYEETGIRLTFVPDDIAWDSYIGLTADCCGIEWRTTILSSYIANDIPCQICSKNKSKGENLIREYLDSHNIKFEEQKRFHDCRNTYPLPFDFYLPDYNTCIEFDGRQHFEIVEHWGGEEAFKYIIKNDSIKSQYCNDKNINLIRIKYDENLIDALKRNLDEII